MSQFHYLNENDEYIAVPNASDVEPALEELTEKVKDIELAKFPNVTIYGQPTINQGQISGFSSANYAKFPFVVNFQNRPFIIDFAFVTGTDVTSQKNVLDSAFGLAFAVRNARFVLAYSTNGTSWNAEKIGTYVVTASTSYRVRIEWDGSTYKVSYSTDGETYNVDMTWDDTTSPYPKQIFIGVTSNLSTVFDGIIDLNYATLTISDKIVWQGMDDVGLSTRLAVDMSNIDEEGVNKIKEIAESSIPFEIGKDDKGVYVDI